MDVFEFRLFGIPRFWHGRLTLRLGPVLQSLLAYLLLHRRLPQSRDVMAGLFWPEQTDERARSCLTTTLWRLRSALDHGGADSGLLVSGPGYIGLNTDAEYRFDVDLLEKTCASVLSRPADQASPADLQALEEALGLYEADLLESFYDDWVLLERERLRLLFESGLRYVLRFHLAHEDWRAALAVAQRLLQHDPLREDIQREAMRLYLRAGERPLALRQYESCRDLLAAELGIEPMPETQALYKRLLGSEPVDVSLNERLERTVPAPDLALVLNQSFKATRALQSAADELNKLTRALESYESGRSA